MHTKRNRRGFTLIELLIVIGIIGFLAAAVLVAVDPVKRIQDSRDARRYSEANGLLNALLTKQVDDRRIYNGASDAPLLTHATNSQVIVTSTSGIECDTVSTATENFPGCNQTLDTSARVSTGTYASIASTTITGSGTNFLTAFRVGDVLREAGVLAGGTCIVRSITDNLNIVCVAAPSPVWSGGQTIRAVSKNCVANLSDTFDGVGTLTIAGAGTAVTGQNSNFAAQISVGDSISSAGQTFTVTAVASDVGMTVSPAAGAGITTQPYTITYKNALVPNYIASTPTDPRGAGETVCATGCTTNAIGISTLGSTNTGYYVHRTTGNRVEVGACAGEQATSISVKR